MARFEDPFTYHRLPMIPQYDYTMRSSYADSNYQASIPESEDAVSEDCDSIEEVSDDEWNRTSMSPQKVQHHESLRANGALNVQNISNSSTPPRSKKSSSLLSRKHNADEDDADVKRNSQTSSASASAESKGMRRKTHVGPWELGSDLGKGCCGKVRKVRHMQSGQVAAVKIIEKKTAELARAESMITLYERTKAKDAASGKDAHLLPHGIEREIVIMKILDHPNIIELYDVWENRNELYLIMEYVSGGELFDYVEKHGTINEDEAVWIFRQLVAALLHCHRLGIHHRDLKPENVLIAEVLDEHSGNRAAQVKLADFGMAALQPDGHMLTTPCGSIHYAAPEVFERSYDGNKIDVWSLGVILYVMLTGLTPFGAGQDIINGNGGPEAVQRWYATIRSGLFWMPDFITPEAQDVISQMLQPSADQRIGMQELFQHDFFRRWRATWAEPKSTADVGAWIGPPLKIDKWHIRCRNDVDAGLLRSLQCLWHSVPEEVLIKKLINKEKNQEKYFYATLLRRQEDQLEDYAGLPDGVAYSTSDYHHAAKAKLDPRELPPVPASAYRTSSQFSIVNDNLKKSSSRANLKRMPGSTGSYDPFRTSPNRLKPGQDARTSVVVHRTSSGLSARSGRSGSNLKPQDSLRVETLKNGFKRLSQASSSSSQLLHRSSISPCPSTTRKSPSRLSMLSNGSKSSLHSSSKLALRPANQHKRGVDFSHARRSSTSSALTCRNLGSAKALEVVNKTESSSSTGNLRDSLRDLSPSTYDEAVISSRKEPVSSRAPRAKPRGHQTNSMVIDTEARKVSTELEKYCEELFNRSSADSSTRTSRTVSQVPYDTPPSSVSNRGSSRSEDSNGRSLMGKKPQVGHVKRSVQGPQKETPNTYLQRTLREAREALSSRDDATQNEQYREVLAQIDHMMHEKNQHQPFHDDPRRIFSAPVKGHADNPSMSRVLGPINEDVSTTEDSSLSPKRSRSLQPPTALSKQRWAQMSASERPSDGFRAFPPNAPPQKIEPLNIRKASNASSSGHSESAGHTSRSGTPAESDSARYYRGTESDVPPPPPPPPHEPARKLMRKSSRLGDHGNLGTISEERSSAGSSFGPSVDTASRNRWFKGKRHPSQIAENLPTDPMPFVPNRSRSGYTGFRDGTINARIKDDDPFTLPLREISNPPGQVVTKKSSKGWLSKLFNSSRNDRIKINTFALHDSDSLYSGSSASHSQLNAVNTTRSKRHSQNSTISSNSIVHPDDLGVHRSWLARILHIKPSCKVLCFNVGRGKVAGEMVRMLRSWKKYGMADIEWNREKKLIFGRVDVENAFQMKPVLFVIEVFAVLEYGHRANLAIARFTQRKGAGSSFRRVIEEMEVVFTNNGILVTDPERHSSMKAILDGAS